MLINLMNQFDELFNHDIYFNEKLIPTNSDYTLSTDFELIQKIYLEKLSDLSKIAFSRWMIFFELGFHIKLTSNKNDQILQYFSYGTLVQKNFKTKGSISIADTPKFKIFFCKDISILKQIGINESIDLSKVTICFLKISENEYFIFGTYLASHWLYQALHNLQKFLDQLDFE